MPLGYKAVTALLALVGSASIVFTGQVIPLMLIPGLGIFPGYYRYLRSMPPAPKAAIGALSTATMVLLIFDSFFVSGDFFIAVAHLTIIFQALKSFDLKDPWDHLQVFFMALLQLVITSELTMSIVFGAVFAVFLVALVAAMVLSHFIKAGTIGRVRYARPLALITIASLVLSGVLFAAVPRVGGFGSFRKGSANEIQSVGFSEKVDFGSFGDIKLDRTVVMRVEITGPRLPLYWRGKALDSFDGNSWRSTILPPGAMRKYGDRFILAPPAPVPTVQRIFMEPLDTEVLFGLGAVTEVVSQGRLLLRDNWGALYLPIKRGRRFSYMIKSAPGVPNAGEFGYMGREKSLALPASMDTARIAALAAEASGDASTTLEAARAIEGYLLRNYEYSLRVPPPPPGVTPVEDFLFGAKLGFCEHYATAMILMLRSLGIPSRIITGFHGGDENTLGGYVVVRQSDAHTWVEAWIDGRWERFDPTPPVASGAGFSALALYMDALRLNWYRYVINYSSIDQRAILRYMSRPFWAWPEMPGPPKPGVLLKPFAVLLAVSLLIAAALWSARRLTRGRLRPESVLYAKFLKRLKKKGAHITPSTTPAEAAREASSAGMEEGAHEFISAYEEARFAGRSEAPSNRAGQDIRDKYRAALK